MAIILKYILPFVLLTISSAWSGWGIYIEYEASDPKLGLVLAVGLGTFGTILSLVFIYFEQQLESSAGGKGPVFVSSILAIVWLGVSPTYNAITIASRNSVQAEIQEIYDSMINDTAGYIDKDRVYSTEIVPYLAQIQQYLNSEIEKQSLSENGKCRAICNEIKHVANLLAPQMEVLATEYHLGDEKKQTYRVLLTLLLEIEELGASNDKPRADLISDFSDIRSKVIEKMREIRGKRDPEKAARYLISQLNSLRQYLEKRLNETDQKGDGAASASRQAAQVTYDTLLPQLQDIKELIDNYASKKIAYSDIPFSYPNVSIGVNLLWKHWAKYWNLLVIAFLVDVVAFSLVFYPLLAKASDHGKIRKIKRKSAEIEILKKDTAKLKSEFEKYFQGNSEIDVKIEKINADAKKLEDDAAKRILDLRQNGQRHITELEDRRIELQVGQEKELSDNEAKKNIEMKTSITPSSQEGGVNERFAAISKNISDKFRHKFALIEKEMEKVKCQCDSEIEFERMALAERKRSIDSQRDILEHQKDTEIKRVSDKLKELNESICQAEDAVIMLRNQ